MALKEFTSRRSLFTTFVLALIALMPVLAPAIGEP